MFEVFEDRESEVRGYCRHFPVMFTRGKNAIMYSADGERYVDFFAGAGALAMGHNNPYIKGKIMDYLATDGIVQALDLYTEVTEKFLRTLNEVYFKPHGLDYKVQFCNASGANSVEAALKLARKNKKRTNIISFTGAYHGQSLGALSVTSGAEGRGGAGVPLDNVTFVPYATDLGTEEASLNYLKWVLEDDHSGVTPPAAVILEAVQGEGGIKVPSVEWLQGVRKICDEHDILMICDEIQCGVCRTGNFFAWERAGIEPDFICVSKSISGFGLPLSMLFIKRELDIWHPGEHTGTFRGNQLALIGATAMLEYIRDNHIPDEVKRKGEIVEKFIKERILPLDSRIEARGIGLFWGIDMHEFGKGVAEEVQKENLKGHLVHDICGREDCVVKILPPLTIEDAVLTEGLEIIEKSLQTVVKRYQ